ncbi:DUF1433 domain-containing protein [Staphylococcus ratti]|uniref:DUF1433 domain-containing protein n=1 Tax=Staphylococcus ratti TaxID=2892440 RepID=A0ABY3PCQ1_9STAP|nr:DUF1433 domain-containing protein [Staphylococcus ratti]UEX90101.1 DUF1433 domain-containing protein [Staphylococcus ratti]
MSKKHILILISIIFLILITIGGVYLKMKHDEQEKIKQAYYKEQQERITLYLKYNTKEPNTIKSVHFTNLEESPMGNIFIEGYINNDPKATFSTLNRAEDRFQFQGGLTMSQPIVERIKSAHELKSPDEIKKELQNNKMKNH